MLIIYFICDECKKIVIIERAKMNETIKAYLFTMDKKELCKDCLKNLNEGSNNSI